VLDLPFGIIGKLGDLDAPCFWVPFENVGTETDARLAVGAFRSINDRTFLQCLSRSYGFRVGGFVICVFLTSLSLLPRKILPISEARAEFTGRSFAVFSPAQAAPGLAAHLALFAIRALLFLLLLGHSFLRLQSQALERHLASGLSAFV